MNAIDWLRKLAVLRFGFVAGRYRSVREMPTSLFTALYGMGVYDAEKELVHRKDLRAAWRWLRRRFAGRGRNKKKPPAPRGAPAAERVEGGEEG